MDVTERVLDKLDGLTESQAEIQKDIALIKADLQYHIRRTDLLDEEVKQARSYFEAKLAGFEKIVKQWRNLVAGTMLSLAAAHPQATSIVTTVITKLFG